MQRLGRIAVGMVIVAWLAGASGVRAAEATATAMADLSSAYVFRGVTLNDGPVLQPALEVSGLPVDLGIWGNLDLSDYDDSLDSGEFSELDLCASYTLPITGLEAYVCYTEYTYPTASVGADREVTLGASYPWTVEPFLEVNYGLDGGVEQSWYFEAGAGYEHPLTDALSLEGKARVGYAAPDVGDDGFSHYLLTLGAKYGVVSATVNYVGQIDDDVLPDYVNGVDADDPANAVAAVAGYDVEFYGTLGVSFDF